MDFSGLARINDGCAEARILQVAVTLGLFDRIGPGGVPAEEVALPLRTHPRATELLLNALVGMGVLRKEGRLFFHTEASARYLLKDSPAYFGNMVLFDAGLWGLWERLEEVIRTGQPVHRPDMFQERAEETERFILAMHSLVMARGDAGVVAGVLDFRQIHDLIDIGSGPGTYPIHFCRTHPHLRATIFDLPATLEVTKKVVGTSGLSGRISFVAGDYNRDPLPSSFDMAFLSNIIHSEDEEMNRRLMRKVYGCLRPGGQVVIKDHILDDSLTHPPVGAIFSITLLMFTTGGRDYSLREVQEWLKEAGFRDTREVLLPPPLTSSLVVGRKQ